MGSGLDGGAASWIWMLGGMLQLLGVVGMLGWIIHRANTGTSTKPRERVADTPAAPRLVAISIMR